MKAKDGFTGLEGRDWLNAEWSDRCSYDKDRNFVNICHIEILSLAMKLFLIKTFLILSLHNEGNLLTPGCSVEPLCRNYTTFGETFCMRDHYYELWDLEKNFGEKTLCEDNLRHPGKNPNIPLEEMIFGEYRARGPEKESERKFDVGVGKESTPYGVVLNDCCVLKISGGKITKNIPDPCSQKFWFDSSHIFTLYFNHKVSKMSFEQ